MTYIKEVIDYNGHCVIRSNSYSHHLDYVNAMFAIAQEDFPELETSQCELVIYGGQMYKNTMGLEFHPGPDVTVPDSYRHIAYAELTL